MRIPAPALAVLLGILLLVQAAPGLHVDGVKVLMDVRPGETYTWPMGVSIDPTDPPTTIAVEVLGVGQGDDGSYNPVSPALDTGPRSARPFVSVDEPALRLNPGEYRSFNATIRVPAGATPGGYYATIYVHPVVEAGVGSGAGVVTAILVPVFLTVPGDGLSETATITEIRDAGPGRLLVTLENTGNHHFYGAVAGVTVTDAAGNTVATGSSAPSVWALVPGGKMSLAVPLSANLPGGNYLVKAGAWNGQGGPLLDTGTLPLTSGAQPAVPAAVSSPEAGTPATRADRPATGLLPGPGPVAIAASFFAAILLRRVNNRG